MEDFLFERFEPDSKRLVELFAASTEDEFRPVCNDELETCIQSVKPELNGAVESTNRQLDSANKALDELHAQESILNAVMRAISQHRGKKTPLYYWILYFLLIGGAIAIFASTYSLIFPEQNFWLGAAQSIVMASPSYMLVSFYKHSRRKDLFLKRLHWIGLASSVLMFVAASVTRAAVYHLLNSSSVASQSGLLAGAGGTSSWLETVQLVASAVAFMFAVATEVCFGGRLMVELSDHSLERI
jgi:hypothetical protein